MTPAGIEPATFRFVAQQFNHCATVVPVKIGLERNVEMKYCKLTEEGNLICVCVCVCANTGSFKMIVVVLTCHTQYTSFSRCNPM